MPHLTEILGSTAGADRRCRKRKDLAARQIRVDLGVTAGVISDLSETGMAVRTAEPLKLKPGERLHVTVPDARRPVQAGCELAWMNAEAAGMRFLVLSENSQRAIMDWLNADSGETIWIPAPAPARSPFTSATKSVIAPSPVSPAAAFTPIEDQKVAALRVQTGLRLLAKLAQLLTGADGAAIVLMSAAGPDSNGMRQMICRASNGRAPETGAVLWADSGVTGECLRSRDVVRCDDTHADPRVDAEACRALRIGSLVALPVFSGSNVIGVLEVLSGAVRGFDEAGLELLPALAALAAHLAGLESASENPARSSHHNGELKLNGAAVNPRAIWPRADS